MVHRGTLQWLFSLTEDQENPRRERLGGLDMKMLHLAEIWISDQVVASCKTLALSLSRADGAARVCYNRRIIEGQPVPQESASVK